MPNSEWHFQGVEVFACFHQNQRAFMEHHRRRALTGYANRLGFGGNGHLRGSHFAGIGVHPNQTRALRQCLQSFHRQGVAIDAGQADAR